MQSRKEGGPRRQSAGTPFGNPHWTPGYAPGWGCCRSGLETVAARNIVAQSAMIAPTTQHAADESGRVPASAPVSGSGGVVSASRSVGGFVVARRRADGVVWAAAVVGGGVLGGGVDGDGECEPPYAYPVGIQPRGHGFAAASATPPVQQKRRYEHGESREALHQPVYARPVPRWSWIGVVAAQRTVRRFSHR